MMINTLCSLSEYVVDTLHGLLIGSEATGWPEAPPLVIAGNGYRITASLNWIVLRSDDGSKLTISRREFPSLERRCAAIQLAAILGSGPRRLRRGLITRRDGETLLNGCTLTSDHLYELREWLCYAGRRAFTPFSGTKMPSHPRLDIAGDGAARFGCHETGPWVDLDRTACLRLAGQFRAALAGNRSAASYGGCMIAVRPARTVTMLDFLADMDEQRCYVACSCHLIRFIVTLEQHAGGADATAGGCVDGVAVRADSVGPA